MEIRVLKSFLKVASTGSFSAAARELNTVQPAISRQIADLEAELGVQLFWRNRREVKITAAGQSLFRDATDILARETWAKEQVLRADRGEIGRLRIGYLSPASFSFLPSLIREYKRLYPQVQISLKEMTVQQQVDAFSSEQIDVGISRPLQKSDRKGFMCEEIYRDRLYVLLEESHSLAGRESLSLSELASEAFVLFSRIEAPGLFDQIISLLHKAKVSPHIASQAENMQTLLTEVASGLGISLVPGCIRNLYSKGCVFVPIQNQKRSISTELHYRSEPVLPIVKSFVELTLNARQSIQEEMETDVR